MPLDLTLIKRSDTESCQSHHKTINKLDEGTNN